MELDRRRRIVTMVALPFVAAALSCAGGTRQATQTAIGEFAACAAAGNPVMESYPRRCRTPDGRTFTETLPPSGGGCRDVCGNGACEEVVCMAIGCPCAESAETCPQDCAPAR